MLLGDATKEAGIPNEIGNGGFGVCDIGETLTVSVKGEISSKEDKSDCSENLAGCQ